MCSKRFLNLPLTLISLTLLVSMCPAQSQATSQAIETEQTIIILDDSESMWKHWEKVIRDYPKLVDRYNRRGSLGALSVGDDCGLLSNILSGGWQPVINLPISANSAQIRNAAGSTIPHGGTYLNAALLHSVSLFQGTSKLNRIVIISDGLNTCPPFMSTCEIARMLHRDYGIVIDIIAWAADPSMIKEFECVSTSTGGSFIKLENDDGLEPVLDQTPAPTPTQAAAATLALEPSPTPSVRPISTPARILEPKPEVTPTSQSQGMEPSHFSVNLWRYVVLALGACTLAFGSIVLYRHAFHVLGWRSGISRIIAGLLILLGNLALYLILFLNSGIMSALIGATLLAMIWLAAYHKPQRSNADIAGTSFFSIALGFLLFFAPPSVLGQQEMSEQPRHHHIIAIDGSGSTKHHLEKMKALCVRYAEVFTKPGEEITVLIFGTDRDGSVKEIKTFTAPQNGTAEIMRKLLESVAIQNPTETRTYFKRLGEFLKDFLQQKVRLDPISVVVSDGKSDDHNDIPFKSFGPGGIYTTPGTTDLLVAVQGGGNLDLTPLLEQPIATTPKLLKGITATDSSPIPPCLFEPDLQLRPPVEIAMRHNIWNPLSNDVHGELIVDASNCVPRFLSFSVQLQLGKKIVDVGHVNHLQIGPTPKSLSFPITIPSIGIHSMEATLAILIEQGEITRTIYAEPTIKLKELGYWSEFEWLWLVVAVTLAGISVILLFAAKRRHRRKGMRAEIITVLGGSSLSVKPGDVFTLGGPGCDLVASGIFDQITLAIAEKMPQPRMLTLRTEDGYRMKINHSEVGTESPYQLGQRVQFCNASSGQIWEITLHAGNPSDLNFGGIESISNNRYHGIAAFDNDPSFINGSAQSGPII